MHIAVAGGTGAVGRYVMEAAGEAGHLAVSLSRHSGVDLTSGAGLKDSLAGVDVIVDTLNIATQSRSKATAFFTTATQHLQREGAAAGVSRLVVLSIVGLEQVPYGYYQAKLAQETAALEGPLPVTIVRATQFHEFAAQVMQRGRVGPVTIVPRMRTQPVAARTVGGLLVEIASGESAERRVEIAGPDVRELPDLVRATADRLGRRTHVWSVRVPGRAGRAMRGDGPLPGTDARIAGPRFDDWLIGDDVLQVFPTG